MKKFIFAIVCIALSSSAIAAEKFKEIDGAAYGDKWPLTFEKAKVSCVNRAYAFVYDIKTDDRYPLNGMAVDAVKSGKLEGSNLDDVWKDDPEYDGVKISISPVIDAATALCN
ncbi:DUF2511 domain-containing protein [Salmonella enterica]|jgi:hypothetical protein|uniref:Protein n=1 Tax=Escherichia coli TaxID=562 RepID=A0A376PRQ1_ECOLX|nr:MULTISPECIES: DUF2511 domain-containing protein [Enterobacteriaceae]EAN4735228.1 DUF2511 domain-containing protein [Salmonella enterica subsp. enterica serovar Soerenga]EBO3462709.1 DUF2511 domain-containing protein [Salmonella enterica subsp. enterica serovar Senftenberg]EEZ5726340.1 DUF2511 domain-containing protein [Escherichia coli O25]EGZ3899883.1 DUF2511 domain-containing protein [Salmonella enterica subsp. enterica serovar Pisa]EKQ4638035.1 DUF2511 domain-containing protein [Salmonel